MHHHRPGKLKQSNKTHVSKHASKRGVERRAAGRVPRVMGLKAKTSLLSTTNRLARANTAMQTKLNKKRDLMLKRRLGGGEGAPKIVTLVPLGPNAVLGPVAESIMKSMDDAVVTGKNPQLVASPITTVINRFKQRFTLYKVASGDIVHQLAMIRPADVVVFVMNLSEGQDAAISDEAQTLITCLKAQGMPSVVGAIQGLAGLKPKVKHDRNRWANRYFESFFGANTKIADSDNSLQLVRALCTVKPVTLSWRDQRAYMVAHSAEWEEGEQGSGVGRLRVSGYLRGRPMYSRYLVTIPEVGTFQVSSVTGPADPLPANPRVPRPEGVKPGLAVGGKGDGGGGGGGGAGGGPPRGPFGARVWPRPGVDEDAEEIASLTPEDCEPLKTVEEVDEMEGEQNWPTTEELAEAEASTRRRRKKVPKGMSEYQAAWLLSDDSEVETESDDDEDGVAERKGDEAGGMDVDAGDFGAAEDMDDGVSMAPESEMEARKLKERRKAESDDLEFPDEVDTPFDVPAKARFARYRGLKSFRTSPWDPKENLPRSYGRIFQFKNFTRYQRLVLGETAAAARRQVLMEASALARERAVAKTASTSIRSRRAELAGTSSVAGGTEGDDMDGAPTGSMAGSVLGSGGVYMDDDGSLGPYWVPTSRYVTVTVEGVSKDALASRDPTTPLVLGCLLRHENRMSVAHYSILRTPAYTAPVKNKELLEFHYGWRRCMTRPVFSEHNLNCDKHKMERFLMEGRWTAATIFAPIQYAPMSLLVFKRGPEGRVLVATGSLISCDPDRIILKRIVLSGYPVKVKRKTAVVRYMFHHPDDIRWFKPVELHTKYGAHGIIKEPVGTHGSMKCVFNKPITQQDTVLMTLFKRVYPKHPSVDEDLDEKAYFTDGPSKAATRRLLPESDFDAALRRHKEEETRD